MDCDPLHNHFSCMKAEEGEGGFLCIVHCSVVSVLNRGKWKPSINHKSYIKNKHAQHTYGLALFFLLVGHVPYISYKDKKYIIQYSGLGLCMCLDRKPIRELMQ